MNKSEEIEKLLPKFNEKLLNENITLSKDELLDKIKEYSSDGKYVFWLMTRYISNGIEKYSDMSRVKECFETYNHFGSDPQIKHLNFMSVKTLDELEDILFNFLEIKREKEVEKLKIDKMKAQTQIIYSGPEGKILIPLTEEASMFWGKGTKWCTAGIKNNLFDRYNEQGPLYILILPEKDKQGRENKYQIHLESKSFMDVTDAKVKENTVNKSKNLKFLLKKIVVLNQQKTSFLVDSFFTDPNKSFYTHKYFNLFVNISLIIFCIFHIQYTRSLSLTETLPISSILLIPVVTFMFAQKIFSDSRKYFYGVGLSIILLYVIFQSPIYSTLSFSCNLVSFLNFALIKELKNYKNKKLLDSFSYSNEVVNG